MARIPLLARAQIILVLVLGLRSSAASSSAASITSSVDPVVSGFPAATASTCQSRAINYITHSLPQQCLATSRGGFVGSMTSSSTSIAEEASDTPSASLATTTAASSSLSSNDDDEGWKNATEFLGYTKTASAVPETASTQDVGSGDGEPESPLDNANFLSFEEWKKQNLLRTGQSADLDEKRAAGSGPNPGRRPGNINNALDSLGDDAEIELDFHGFVASTADARPGKERAGEGESDADAGRERTGDGEDGAGDGEDGAPSAARPRSKDAGTTCKERFNYASFDCAATVLKTDPQCKGSSSILVENKDSYMLDECSADNKFIIVELCDIILVDTVVLANFEFFSSMFRTFRVSISDRYPVKMDRWRELGTYEARNSRDIQAFRVENPLIWAKYLRIEFLTHFGNEYYCPVSLLRVHGTTMMEEFRAGSDPSRGEDEIEEVADAAIPDDANATEMSDGSADLSSGANSHEANRDGGETEGMADAESRGERKPVDGLCERIPAWRSASHIFTQSMPLCGLEERWPTQSTTSHGTVEQSESTLSTSADEQVTSKAEPSPSSTDGGSAAGPPSMQAEKLSSDPSQQSSVSSEGSIRASPTNSSEASRVVSSSHAPSAMPTTQESFFKTIHKRLQLLESNSTLSLQYIEEQSRILRDAFTKVEKRQLAKTSTFLENLNETVLTELRGFREQYDQIWQSTIIELENQREQSQREIVAVSSRLSLLADEVIFQKRMSIIQSVLLLLCIGLLIFSRSAGTSNYLEVPVFQSMLNRSSSWLKEEAMESPERSPSSTRPQSSWAYPGGEGNGVLADGSHRRQTSDGSVEMMLSPALEFSPPTPVSITSESQPPSQVQSPSESPSRSPRRASPSESEEEGGEGQEGEASSFDRPSPSPSPRASPRASPKAGLGAGPRARYDGSPG